MPGSGPSLHRRRRRRPGNRLDRAAGTRAGGGGGMRIMLWHVHGSWTTAVVQGRHEYLIPTLPDRGKDGLGRARTWDWPPGAIEVGPEEAAEAEVDALIVQRPDELDG